MEELQSDVMLSYAWWQPQIRGKIQQAFDEQIRPFMGEGPPSSFSSAAHSVLGDKEASIVSCSGFTLEWITYQDMSKVYATPVPHWLWFIATRNWLYRGRFVTREIPLGLFARNMLSAYEPRPYFPLPEVASFTRISYQQILATSFQVLDFPDQSDKHGVPIYLNHRMRPEEFGYGGITLGNLQGTFANTFEDYYFFDANAEALQLIILEAQSGQLQNTNSASGSTSSLTAPTNELVNELRQLAELRDAGILTESEFELAKRKLLS